MEQESEWKFEIFNSVNFIKKGKVIEKNRIPVVKTVKANGIKHAIELAKLEIIREYKPYWDKSASKKMGWVSEKVKGEIKQLKGKEGEPDFFVIDGNELYEKKIVEIREMKTGRKAKVTKHVKRRYETKQKAIKAMEKEIENTIPDAVKLKRTYRDQLKDIHLEWIDMAITDGDCKIIKKGKKFKLSPGSQIEFDPSCEGYDYVIGYIIGDENGNEKNGNENGHEHKSKKMKIEEITIDNESSDIEEEEEAEFTDEEEEDEDEEEEDEEEIESSDGDF